TLPTNIIPTKTNLLELLKSPVIPKLKPTVLYAEKHSKAMSSNPFFGSKCAIRKMPKPITINESAITANALLTEISAISLLKISILLFPFARLIKLSVAMAKVLVLIPPPVDAGEAPIHINRIIIMMEEKCNWLKSIELNPAVLGVVAVNIAVTIFPIPLCSTNVLAYSFAKITTEPIIIKEKVVMRLSLLLNVNNQGL